MDLNKLKKYGFKEVGEWYFYEKIKSKINFKLNEDYKNKRVIYAFIVDNKVKYIGCCQKKNITLENRMKRYKSRTGKGTNERVAKEIKKCVENNKAVKIFALEPKEKIRYKNLLKIDLINGLEDPLISKFEPEWNKKI